MEITKNEIPSKVETVIENNVSVYPNPVMDVLNINSPDNTKEIKIFDTLGKLIYQGTIEKQIDTKSFDKGIYIVQLSFDNGKSFMTKIIK